MKRFNKEYKLDVCNHMSLKYGTVNKDNPQVIYVSGKCWIKTLKEQDYEKVLLEIEKKMKKNIKLFLANGEDFSNKFILDFDISLDNFIPNKKKFLSFDFYLKQKELNQKTLIGLKDLLKRKISTISNKLVYEFQENGFLVEKKK